MVDDLMFYGRGAGKFPTASAVVSDVMECARNIGRNIPINWRDEVMQIADPMNESYRYFVRISAEEEAKAHEVFSGSPVIHAKDAPSGELAFVTLKMTEKQLQDALASFGTVKQCIRLLQD